MLARSAASLAALWTACFCCCTCGDSISSVTDEAVSTVVIWGAGDDGIGIKDGFGCANFEGARDESDGAVVGAVEGGSIFVSEGSELVEEEVEVFAERLSPDMRVCIRLAQKFGDGSAFSTRSVSFGESTGIASSFFALSAGPGMGGRLGGT